MKTGVREIDRNQVSESRELPTMPTLHLVSRQAVPLQELSGLPGAVCGHLAGIDEEGRVLFQEDQAQPPYPVAIGLPLEDEAVAEAAHLQRRALVVRTDDRQAVVVALLRERISAAARDKEFAQLTTGLSGKAVEIEAQKSLELQCGRAKITLHADGRIELHGDYLLSRSRGPLKLKGASIDIN